MPTTRGQVFNKSSRIGCSLTLGLSRLILQSFISSIEQDTHGPIGHPECCAYQRAAKQGRSSILAIGTRLGSVHVFDTSRPRTDGYRGSSRLLASTDTNSNLVVDLQWNTSDSLLAAACADPYYAIVLLDPETGTVSCTLTGHTLSAKAVAWSPVHPMLLMTGGRDGTIRLWDIRCRERTWESESVSPITSIVGAHEQWDHSDRRTLQHVLGPCHKTITSLTYDCYDDYHLISGGSFNGCFNVMYNILQRWNTRFLSDDYSRSPARPILSSCHDPTTISNRKHPRGVVSLCQGINGTSTVIFTLSMDSSIHTYSRLDLQPIGTPYKHPAMLTNSFGAGLALSPCGRWIACSSVSAEARVYLFDVQNVTRMWEMNDRGVELRGVFGRAGKLDWGEMELAVNNHSGAVSIWRPSPAVY
ncbi:WD40-repeat-containing domain protein [Desarmillaria tabescens]|uniref:WD40-repeat-containing domain protein n=1 Tax=Armillaria tabescens TaxID=1929756 RepID=A0AA39MII4_ARMTA|nr:WD40-repeat-containing domain protein [Desarmillaria tabescens]KAK0435093.1 WD40-repeat-containing domain protein [Desarmillaria tabescens]